MDLNAGRQEAYWSHSWSCIFCELASEEPRRGVVKVRRMVSVEVFMMSYLETQARNGN
jgi:hypothetical protein